MNDSYLLLKVGVAQQFVERVENAMLNCGALSSSCQDANDKPVLEPAPGTAPLWPDVIVTGVFGKQVDETIVTHLVNLEISEFTDQRVMTESLEDTQWERVWMEDFKPVEITPRLWVVPTFCDAPDPEAVNVTIDPGLAFGSGTHPTTHLCLQWLGSEDIKGKTVIDYGCGSGILAVAAALLGSAQVYAFDIDAQALQATRENAELNNVADKITICHSDKDLPSNIDMVVANILLAPLLELSSRFHELLGDQGKLGISGVLCEQVTTLTKAYTTQFRNSSTDFREQWVIYTANKAP